MGLYDPVLTNIGLLSNGKLTESSRNKFFSSVAQKIEAGNSSLGGDTFTFPGSSNGLKADQLADKSKFPMLHSTFLDSLIEKTATNLDLPGNTPLASAPTFIFDVTAVKIPPGITIPNPVPIPPSLDLLAKILGIDIKSPTFLAELPVKLVNELKIQVALPKPPPIPTLQSLGLKLPNIPQIPVPKIPDIQLPVPVIPNLIVPPIPGLPPLVMPDFALSFYKLPFQIILDTLVPDPVSLLKLVTDVVPKLPFSIIDLLLSKVAVILKSLNLVNPPVPKSPPQPSLLLAAVLTVIESMAAMISCVLISQIVGTGLIAAGPALSLGLI